VMKARPRNAGIRKRYAALLSCLAIFVLFMLLVYRAF